MNNTKKQSSDYQHVVAVTRKTATKFGIVRLGAEYFSASLIRVLGEAALPVLTAEALNDIGPVMRHLPDATPEEGQQLPPVVPDGDLVKLLAGPLSGLSKGEMTLQEALGALLNDKQTKRKLQGLLLNLPSKTGTAIKQELATSKGAAPGVDIQLPVRKFTRALQTAFSLSSRRYRLDEKCGTSDFATGRCDADFYNALKEWEREMRESRLLLYGGSPKDKGAYFNRLMREFGPVASDVMAAVLIHSVTPFTGREMGIFVRDLAWSLRPAFPHAFIPDILNSAKVLAKAGNIRVFPEAEHCHLESYCLPTDEALAGFGASLK